jgi:hypothetical protein
VKRFQICEVCEGDDETSPYHYFIEVWSQYRGFIIDNYSICYHPYLFKKTHICDKKIETVTAKLINKEFNESGKTYSHKYIDFDKYIKQNIDYFFKKCIYIEKYTYIEE